MLCIMQVYRPMETLFVIAAFTTLAENFLPQLIAIPRVGATSQSHVQHPGVIDQDTDGQC